MSRFHGGSKYRIACTSDNIFLFTVGVNLEIPTDGNVYNKKMIKINSEVLILFKESSEIMVTLYDSESLIQKEATSIILTKNQILVQYPTVFHLLG